MVERKLVASIVDADHKRYRDPEYSDSEVDGLMSYFRVDAYKTFLLLLKGIGARRGEDGKADPP